MTDVVNGRASASTYDPITFSVFMSRFESIANEMTLTLENSAWTSILALCRDFSCAIYDAVPRQICMLDAIPIHTTSLQLVLQEIARSFEGSLEDGDVFLCNDPYRGNTHVGDLVTACPVFVEGAHLFWAATRGHQMDTGAFVPSSVTAGAENVWQEGLTIPPLKLYEAGELRKDVLDLYLSNMRYREALEGDLLAQLGSIEKGRQRLIEFCVEYGSELVIEYVEQMIAYADRRMSELIRSMPDGQYSGEGWVDSDGIDTLNIPIKARVTIDDDRITVDYSESGSQAKGGLNGSVGTSRAAAAIPFLYYIDPDIPHNDGCIRHIDVILREGTICNPKFPASTSAATIVPSDMMQDAINKAMASAVPELVIAGSCRCGNVPQFSGIDERTDDPWAVMFFNNSGGSGAVKGYDGWPLWESQAAAGALKDQPVEQIELLYPLIIEQWEIEPDSMGFGEWNGGPGNRFVVKPIAGSAECITFGDGCANPPHGVLGGTPAIGGGQYVENRTTGKRAFVGASGHLRIESDEVWVGVSTGGGGYGNPLDRDPERVRQEVADEIVSRAAARGVFGVVLAEDADEPGLDVEGTERLRSELRARPRPLVEPTTPGASTWIRDNMQAGDEFLLNPTA
jgi:N-methylhydantoinase B